MPTIQIVSGTSQGLSYDLVDRDTSLGRHPTCDIQLRETTVSRRHARIYSRGDEWFIEDTKSQHGTLLNGHPITSPQALRDQDEIRLSECVLMFHSPASERGQEADESDRVSSIVTSIDASSAVQSSTTLENSALKLRAVLEIIQSFGKSLDIHQIFPSILESVFRIFPQAQRGYILLAEPPDGRLVTYASHTRKNLDERLQVSRTITRMVMDEGKAILSTDTNQDERFSSSESIGNLEIHSIICAPMMDANGKPLGMIHVDTRDLTAEFDAENLEVLANIANLAGKVVEHARLHQTQIEFARRQSDLETAKNVQLHFLPQSRPDVPGYELADFYRAAGEVGGDYFGYIDLPDGRLAIAMGDVAGKGVSAALLMARLCSDVRFNLVSKSPEDAVNCLNQQITNVVEYSQFVTFALCILDPQTHELGVMNAGHMHPLLRRAATGEIEQLALGVKGPPLGVDESRVYRISSCRMEPGDLVFLYTDGISDATSKKNEMFGVDRVERLVVQPQTALEAIRKFEKEITSFTRGQSQTDDICMVCFSRNAE